MVHELLSGTYDLHIHTAPDVIPRKCTDEETVRRLEAAGMKGCAIKCHYFETAARAALLQERFPQMKIVGGLVLNRSVGGINPEAVERFGQMGGRMLWFPTMDARSFQQYKKKTSQVPSHFLTASGADGKLAAETVRVLETAARYQLTLGTGHLNADEGLALLREGKRLGIERMMVTHVEHPALNYSIEQQREAAAMGAMIEHSFNNVFFRRSTIEEIARQIRAVGCGHVILTSDLGQTDAPYSDEGMLQFAEALLKQGITEQELAVMMKQNPEKLITLP